MKKIHFIFIFILFLVFTIPVYGQETEKNTAYVTVVIPLRSREYWQDNHRVTPIFDFLKTIKRPITVLLQYSVLNDQEMIKYLKELPPDFEIGLFLEVDENLANKAQVSYLYGIGDRAHSNIILTSAYEVNERKRIIDENFDKFNKTFGFTPQSVGAWYIDSISQGYLKSRYRIKAILDVADQWNTDTYGLWGKPWGIPFIPSRFNPLAPSQNNFDESGIVKIQWAARDPIGGYGLTVNNSTYSIQANDYIGHGFGIEYFNSLADVYLNGFPNDISQLTVGLEAGQEGTYFLDEFTREINALKDNNFLTMSQFAQVYYDKKNKDSGIVIASKNNQVENVEAYWINFNEYRAYLYREGNKLEIRDIRLYEVPNLYKDVFYKDSNKFLTRITPFCIDFSRSGKSITISDKIESLNAERRDNDIVFEITEENSNRNMVFNNKGIRIDGKNIFDSDSQSDAAALLKKIFYHLIHEYQVNRASGHSNRFVISNLNGINYFGFTLFPDRLIGINTKFPYFGVYNIPFQVLSKFKYLNSDKFLLAFAKSFVYPSINCKISL